MRAYPLRVRPFPLSVPLTAHERAAVDQLKASAALGTDADVVRLALWRLAEHYDLRLPLETFRIGPPLARPGARRARRKSPQTA